MDKSFHEVEVPPMQNVPTRLASLQTNGELDAEQVNLLLNAKVESMEKQQRWLKWAVLIFGVFSLLSIVAIVGLVYDVDHLSEDMQLGGNMALVSTSTGKPIGTSQVVSSTHSNLLYKMDPEDLHRVTSITIPTEHATYVAQVASISLVPNVSAIVSTADGKAFLFTQDGIHAIYSSPATNATGGNQGRRLLQLPPNLINSDSSAWQFHSIIPNDNDQQHYMGKMKLNNSDISDGGDYIFSIPTTVSVSNFSDHHLEAISPGVRLQGQTSMNPPN